MSTAPLFLFSLSGGEPLAMVHFQVEVNFIHKAVTVTKKNSGFFTKMGVLIHDERARGGSVEEKPHTHNEV